MKNKINTHFLFIASLLLKGAYASIESLGGLALLFADRQKMTGLILKLSQEELSEDPKDLIAHYLIKTSENFSAGTQHFIGFYLLTHGLIKIGLIGALLKNRLWAYPVSIAVFALFIAYQLYRYYFLHSPWLLILTLFDILILWLIRREYLDMKIGNA
jgi:uncharacterized membrane protein